jgi:hypothetical protein
MLGLALVAVTANYAMQIPDTLHLYGTAFSRAGAILLGSTLVWFVAAVGLIQVGRLAGYRNPTGIDVVGDPRPLVGHARTT